MFIAKYGHSFHAEDSDSDYEPSIEESDSEIEEEDDGDINQLPQKFPTNWKLLPDCDGLNCEQHKQMTHVSINFTKLKIKLVTI